jgi:hypothetical protein
VKAEKYLIADQQVQHLNHFCSPQSFFCDFYLSHFFIMFLPQFFGSSAGDSAIQSSGPEDSFDSVIKDIIRGLEDDPTQKELRANDSRAEERPPVVAQEYVPSTVAQENVSKRPATYFRRAKKEKQMRVCVVIIISSVHFHSQSFLENIHIIAYFTTAVG